MLSHNLLHGVNRLLVKAEIKDRKVEKKEKDRFRKEIKNFLYMNICYIFDFSMILSIFFEK